MKILSQYFPNFAVLVVLMMLFCHTAIPVYAVNDSISSRPVGIIARDFSFQAQKPRSLFMFAQIIPATNEKQVNLYLKRLSSYEVYRLQHLPRQDFVFIRFSLPDRYRISFK